MHFKTKNLNNKITNARNGNASIFKLRAVIQWRVTGIPPIYHQHFSRFSSRASRLSLIRKWHNFCIHSFVAFDTRTRSLRAEIGLYLRNRHICATASCIIMHATELHWRLSPLYIFAIQNSPPVTERLSAITINSTSSCYIQIKKSTYIYNNHAMTTSAKSAIINLEKARAIHQPRERNKRAYIYRWHDQPTLPPLSQVRIAKSIIPKSRALAAARAHIPFGPSVHTRVQCNTERCA